MITDNTNNNFALRINFNLKKIANVGGKRAQIWLTTTINGERVRIYTRQLINEEHWVKSVRSDLGGGYAKEDKSLGRITFNANKAINKKLREICGFCEDYVKLVSETHLQARNTILQHSKESFKEYVESRIVGNQVESLSAERFILNYIDFKAKTTNKNTGRTLSRGTIFNHKNALSRLKRFTSQCGLNLSWRLFDERFEDNFRAWMHAKDYTPNTIASEFSIIKVWLTEAEKKGLMESAAFHHYKTATHDVDNVYLTEDELKRLYELDLSNAEINSQSKLEETRDLFIVGCYTGLRYSDYGSLPRLTDGAETISVRCQKTDARVVIPLHPYVKAIYRKYNGVLPKPIDKGKALKNIRYCARLAQINALVTLSKTHGGITTDKTCEKWQAIMNHTARRTFATNMYLRGVPSISIMSVTGHTTESNFMKYIKVSSEQHAKIVASHF